MIVFIEPTKICPLCGRIFKATDLQQIWNEQGFNPSCKPDWSKRKYCGGWCSHFVNPKTNALHLGSRTITRQEFYEYVKKYSNRTVMLKDFVTIF